MSRFGQAGGRCAATPADLASVRCRFTVAPVDAANLRHRLSEMLVSAAGETLAPGGAW
ncbi:hypothetical protein ACWEKJ_33185 [Amycolatopsis thermoflava]